MSFREKLYLPESRMAIAKILVNAEKAIALVNKLDRIDKCLCNLNPLLFKVLNRLAIFIKSFGVKYIPHGSISRLT
jgi:hypothetical protein